MKLSGSQDEGEIKEKEREEGGGKVRRVPGVSRNSQNPAFSSRLDVWLELSILFSLAVRYLVMPQRLQS